MKKFRSLVYKLDDILGYCACALTFLGVILVVVSVFVRLFRFGAITGMTDYLGFMTAITVAFSIPWVEKNKGHIRVELLQEYLPKKISTAILAVLDFICMVTILIICWRFFAYALETYQTGMKTWVAFLHYWPAAFVCCIGMLAFFLTALINYIDMFRMPAEEKETEEAAL